MIEAVSPKHAIHSKDVGQEYEWRPPPQPYPTTTYFFFSSHLLFRALTHLYLHVQAPSVCLLLLPQTTSPWSLLNPGLCIWAALSALRILPCRRLCRSWNIFQVLGLEVSGPRYLEHGLGLGEWALNGHIRFVPWTPWSCPLKHRAQRLHCLHLMEGPEKDVKFKKQYLFTNV